MKYRNIKLFIPSMLLLFIISMTSCVNDLNVQPIDPNVILTLNQDGVFAKIYSSLALTGQEGPAGNGDVAGIDEGTSAFIRLIWNLNELTTDEALCSWGDPGIPEMNYNNWSSSHSQIQGLYYRLYFNITLCNQFLTQTTGMTDSKSVTQRAEARFMRAMNYYYLLDMFGNVPFAETVSINTAPQQIKRADLFAYVNKELAGCEKDMFQVGDAKPYYRVNVVANWLLRSRLFLNSQVYTGTATVNKSYMDSAAIYANKVMDGSGYTLCPVFRQLFMADNAGAVDGSSVNLAPNEIIFPIAQDGIDTKSYGGIQFLMASTRSADMPSWGSSDGWGGNRARATLVKKFFPTGSTYFTDPNDLTTTLASSPLKDNRALFFLGKRIPAVSGKDSILPRTLNIQSNSFTQGYSVIKYTNLRADGGKTHDTQFADTDVPFMRAAEAYLNYAEAVTRGGNAVGSYTALSAFNALRTRAGAKLLAATPTLQNIIDERAKEFFFEGYRRSDLIRFGQYGGTDVTYEWDWKGGEAAGINFDDHFNIFPIPSTDITANPNLIQNPKY